MNWKPASYGVEKLEGTYGPQRTQLLISLLQAQMSQQVASLGSLCREISELGGIFGLEGEIPIAQTLQSAIGIVRGQIEHRGDDVPALRDAREALSLLDLPAHPVTLLPTHRMPIWEDANGADKG